MTSFLDDARYRWRRMTAEEREAELAWRRDHALPWHSPAHCDVGEGAYHLSAACFEHRPIIGAAPARMREFTDALLAQICPAVGAVDAWCVLPNHYHILVRTGGLASVSRVVGRLHGRTSHRWNGEDGCRGRKVWFNYLDRVIGGEAHYWETLNYIHNNAVHHGYVEQWQDWPYSSADAFLERVGREEAVRIWRTFRVGDCGHEWDDPAI
ncbi:transposase [bacterium]|nr:transposase [bacterium]